MPTMTGRAHVVKDLVTRLSPLVAECVAAAGRARGSTDAPAILAALSPGQATELWWLCRYGFQPGELASWIAEMGLLVGVELFAPNGNGFWPHYCTHTVGMLLTHPEIRLLDAAGKTPAHIVSGLGRIPADALTSGWEQAICTYLTTRQNNNPEDGA